MIAAIGGSGGERNMPSGVVDTDKDAPTRNVVCGPTSRTGHDGNG